MRNRKLRIRRRLRRAAGLIAATGAAFLLHSCGRAEAEPMPNPDEVRQFLLQLEAQEAAGVAEQARSKSSRRHLIRAVENAAVRAPSDAMVNRLERAVFANLG
jgi:hypothetical protein